MFDYLRRPLIARRIVLQAAERERLVIDDADRLTAAAQRVMARVVGRPVKKGRCMRSLTGMANLGTLAIAILVSLTLVIAMSVSVAESEELFGQWRFEVGLYGGAFIADTEVGRDVSATSGEQLIGRLDTGAIVGTRLGLHSDLLGLDLNLATGTGEVTVRSESGVGFREEEQLRLLSSGDVLLYPFRRALWDGKLRPYVTTGVGAMIFAADLDNSGGREHYADLVWNAGGGMKYFFGKEERLLLDLQVKNHRVFGSPPIRDFNVQSATIGIGFRF